MSVCRDQNDILIGEIVFTAAAVAVAVAVAVAD